MSARKRNPISEAIGACAGACDVIPLYELISSPDPDPGGEWRDSLLGFDGGIYGTAEDGGLACSPADYHRRCADSAHNGARDGDRGIPRGDASMGRDEPIMPTNRRGTMAAFDGDGLRERALSEYGSPTLTRDNKGPAACHARDPYSKPPQVVARRNARERRRVHAVNAAFARLRRVVPSTIAQHARTGRRVSKLNTLKRALDYIGHLRKTLEHGF